MKDLIRWKVYYGDFSTFSNLNGDIYSVPSVNVQAICVKDNKVGRMILSRKDFYSIDEMENFSGFDLFGLFDYLSQNGPKKILFGRTIPNEKFDEIIKLAINDSDFPIKSAKHFLET